MSQSYEAKGTIKKIGETDQVSEKFKKREIVLTTEDEKYPQDVKFEFVQDKCALLDDFSEGDEATITFNLRGSEYNGKHYVNLTGWKIVSGEAF
jgi:single-strand DNA-binding protein